MRLFIDTNVLIDFMGERAAYYLQAASLFSLAADRQCEVVVSSLSMVTANYICCERGCMSLEVWKQKVNALRDFICVCSIDADDIFSACDKGWKDYEDCVQFHAVKRCECDLIVTRNVVDFCDSDIEVLTPQRAIDRVLSV